MSDPFDLKDQAVVVERLVAPRRIAKRRQQFVLVPLAAADALGKACRDKIWPLYLHLVHETWKANGKPVKIANGFLVMLGIDRFAKNRALKKLEKLGLVRVEWRVRRSPLVTVLAKGVTAGLESERVPD
jgi:hypothetical protein